MRDCRRESPFRGHGPNVMCFLLFSQMLCGAFLPKSMRVGIIKVKVDNQGASSVDSTWSVYHPFHRGNHSIPVRPTLPQKSQKKI